MGSCLNWIQKKGENMKTKEKIIIRLSIRGMLMAVVCFLVIASGITGMSLLGASKQEPPQKEILKKSLSVATIPVVKQDAAVLVIGYGQAFPVNIMEISPQVSGTILEKNETLEQGGRVEQGDLLFKLDTTNFKIEAEKAAIKIKLQENQVAQLQVSYKKDQGRLAAVEQNTRLSKAEFSRLKELYDKDRVGKGGTLTVSLKDIEISEPNYIDGKNPALGNYLQLEVSDTGYGMNNTTLKKSLRSLLYLTKELIFISISQ